MLDPQRIKLRRVKEGLTQKQLGEAIGQDQAYISRIEKGITQSTTTQTLEKLADVLKVSTDYLLGRVPESDPDLMSVAAVAQLVGT
ncbi:hypothetical protein C2W62_10975 [Candidatus Entotheonella serta]|nr:hypothetical protein C2W62_10975 [Candidatus Entotheonella serta]